MIKINFKLITQKIQKESYFLIEKVDSESTMGGGINYYFVNKIITKNDKINT